jgi:hypothetical protein
VRRRADIQPGTALIVRKDAYRRLARAGLVGPPLLTAHGRTGNVRRERVVLVRTKNTLDVPRPNAQLGVT